MTQPIRPDELLRHACSITDAEVDDKVDRINRKLVALATSPMASRDTFYVDAPPMRYEVSEAVMERFRAAGWDVTLVPDQRYQDTIRFSVRFSKKKP